MSRAISIKEFIDKTFIIFPFTDKWKEHIGMPERNFKAIIFGSPGNGKTDYAIKLSKYLAELGSKVYYNSFEEGISCTLQQAIIRNDLIDVQGKISFGDKETLDEMIVRLKRKGSANVVVIDSRDYMNLTTEQFKRLVGLFPRKAFILLCWSSANKPKGEYAKAIEYMCDIKIRVHNFVSYPRSRFGGNEKFIIWNKNAQKGEQLKIEVL
jgi:hypothetical protein